jgi:hypothetical protein
MSLNGNDHNTFRQYLLGQVGGVEREQLEQRLFSDDEVFEEFLAIEDELIEASIGNELSATEIDQFKNCFLITPDRQEKLQFRRALQRVAKKDRLKYSVAPAKIRRVQTWIPQLAMSVAALIIVGGIIWMLLPRTMEERTLVAGLSERGSGTAAETIKLPVQFDDLKLHLTLPQPSIPAKDYRVEMRSVDGTTKTLRTVSHNQQFVDVIIPTSKLSHGQFALKVYAINPDSSEQPIPNSYLLTID